VIARIWRGETKRENAAEYMSVIRETGVRDYRAIDGNHGVLVFTRSRDERTEFTVLTLWRSLDSISQFAGEDINRARYYPQDERYLLSFPTEVEHVECTLADMDGLSAGL
jgi:heme-degrading monooxygenase HmoA